MSIIAGLFSFYFGLTFILRLSNTKQNRLGLSLLLYTVALCIRIRACCSCNRRIKHVIIDCAFCLQFVVQRRLDNDRHHTFVF